VTNLPVRISVDVPQEDAELLALFLEHCNPEMIQHCTHGPLSVERLIVLLLEDVALAVRRPGSWEGAHMSELLAAHGYQMP
jgi:hypothetical protein